MSPNELKELQNVIAPDIDRLRRLAAEHSDNIIAAPPSDGRAMTIVDEFCRRIGIYDAISAFFSEDYRHCGYVIHLSHPGDTWFHVFDDIGLTMPKTTQMHFDLAFEVPKAMLYINDVGEKQGPFSIVPKLSAWERFGTEHAFRRESLYAVEDFMKETFGKATQGNTSIFRHPEARQAFASLPSALRKSSHFGDHVMDNTELSTGLLGSEKRLVGEAGTALVFAGSHTLHRGGLVNEGERIALQIVFPKGGPAKMQTAPGKLQPLDWIKRGFGAVRSLFN
jgi:hypothetical protein